MQKRAGIFRPPGGDAGTAGGRGHIVTIISIQPSPDSGKRRSQRASRPLFRIVDLYEGVAAPTRRGACYGNLLFLVIVPVILLFLPVLRTAGKKAIISLNYQCLLPRERTKPPHENFFHQKQGGTGNVGQSQPAFRWRYAFTAVTK
jgi:hypothetical protein